MGNITHYLIGKVRGLVSRPSRLQLSRYPEAEPSITPAPVL
ncbi:MAG TPA: hypothetical protein VL092_06470 [Chitinophagaceae bacterium]|nr:hypothetical protein [Chitinophagaceae bacterium]